MDPLDPDGAPQSYRPFPFNPSCLGATPERLTTRNKTMKIKVNVRAGQGKTRSGNI
jgi:hypothetical protein